MRVGLLGLGSWGTALAAHLGDGGHDLTAWTLESEDRAAIARDRENRRLLPGRMLPERMRIVETPAEAVAGAEIALLAVPSLALRGVAGEIAPAYPKGPVVNVAKGLEVGTEKLPLQVLAELFGPDRAAVSLVGPSHAEEVALGYPTAVVAASRNRAAAELVQAVFAGERLRVYTNDDTLGVELAVALKNVIAIAAGISAGLGFGDNTLGALVTRGLAEMTRMGVALGARPETFFGLAGVGDMVTTSVSRHSRNRHVGEAVGRGGRLEDVLASMTMVAEGVPTTRAAKALARRVGVEAPIVDRVHAVLFEGEDPREAIRALMTREPKSEAPSAQRAGEGKA